MKNCKVLQIEFAETHIHNEGDFMRINDVSGGVTKRVLEISDLKRQIENKIQEKKTFLIEFWSQVQISRMEKAINKKRNAIHNYLAAYMTDSLSVGQYGKIAVVNDKEEFKLLDLAKCKELRRRFFSSEERVLKVFQPAALDSNELEYIDSLGSL